MLSQTKIKQLVLFDFLDEKRTNGQYFTIHNPFANDGFYEWSKDCNLKNANILEPFAGALNLIKMLQEMGLCKSFSAYDIEPKNELVQYRNSLENFPKNFSVCITNPPYLAGNSAKRRGLDFPDCNYDDLYKFCLEKCLQNCNYVAAIIPASFLNSQLFRNRLSHYILLNAKMFNDTEHPVCLALFKSFSDDVKIYNDQKFIGKLSELEKKLPKSKNKINLKFNDKKGQLGLFAIDNTISASIHFCEGNQISEERIGISSRSITRIGVDYSNIKKLIKNLNDYLMDFRDQTADVFLTPFKGLRQDGKYRRRLDYALARAIINDVL